MNVLVLGATGATGAHLTRYLIEHGHSVKAVVRSPQKLGDTLINHPNMSVIKASVLDMPEAELNSIVADCHAVASCLGHNVSFRGIYGHPRRLVTDTARRVCKAIKEVGSPQPVKYVLMNTTGNSNRDLDEQISFAQSCVMVALRLLLPPHVDNEKAADFLRVEIGQNDPSIEWCAVRPDGLVDEDEASDIDVHPSPIRSAIFDPGSISRINVAHFMGKLIEDQSLWETWKGRMPVIYSRENTK